MIVALAVIAGLWMLALVVLASASDTKGAVSLALASDEPIRADHFALEAKPVRSQQQLAA